MSKYIYVPYSEKLTRYQIGLKEINAVDELCLYSLNEINGVTNKRFQNLWN